MPSSVPSSMEEQIILAADILKKGDLVAFPTETVYGLAACIDQPMAIEKIFKLKERPFFDPLIVHASELKQAKMCYSSWNHIADELARQFWPGPLTLVMTKSEFISDMITSGLPSVGVRIPQHETALKLIESVGVPLAAPSANKFGKTSPTHSMHVKKEFGDSIFILNGDENKATSNFGIESTVLMLKEKNFQASSKVGLSILRKGLVVKSDIDIALKSLSNDYEWLETVSKKESPGHMKHHYMPDIPFVICKNPNLKLAGLVEILNQKLQLLPNEVEGVKIIKPINKISKVEFLTLPLDAKLAARDFYSKLRQASQRKPDILVFIETPSHQSELWESLFDRMYKAASLIIE